MRITTKCAGVATATLSPSLGLAHSGPIAADAVWHGLTHVLEIGAVVLVSYAVFMCCRKALRS